MLQFTLFVRDYQLTIHHKLNTLVPCTILRSHYNPCNNCIKVFIVVIPHCSLKVRLLQIVCRFLVKTFANSTAHN